MRAVRCHELTGPAGLRVDTIDPPTPGPDQVVVEVRAAGVNFPDVLITQGKYQFDPPRPFVLGGEVAGIVTAVGANVQQLAPGDRVCATMLAGAFAEQACCNAAMTVRLPAGVAFEAAAALPVAYGTTLHALVDRAALQRDQTLLVLGAGGGVGLAAVQLGRRLGARVIAAASSEAKLAIAKAHGADATIDVSREDLRARAKALAPEGVDVVYDPVGGALTEAAVRSLGWQGRLLVVGFASGEIPKLPLNLVLLKGCQIVGVFWGAFANREPARNRAHLEQLLQWLAQGELVPHLDAVLPLDRAAEALQRLADRRVRGKLVLVP
ncbi:MAG: NADPH:quinone oxidoreductase family protein [Nannocystaceae bacterium]|nr:NADPH:quinone oxidoreductase family protein [Nannocystaceae bacterium]